MLLTLPYSILLTSRCYDETCLSGKYTSNFTKRYDKACLSRNLFNILLTLPYITYIMMKHVYVEGMLPTFSLGGPHSSHTTLLYSGTSCFLIHN